MDINNDNSRTINIGSHASAYLPEPSNTGIGMFNDVMSAVTSAAAAGARVFSTTGGGMPAVSESFHELLSMQIEAQKQMQSTSMQSNIERSKHETKMAAIRNMRIS